MHYELVEAEYLDGYRLRLTFRDGKTGVVDFAGRIRRGGVFKRLADPKRFRAFSIDPDFGALRWGQEADVAPETLYEQAVGGRTCSRVAESAPRYRTRRTPAGRRLG